MRSGCSAYHDCEYWHRGLQEALRLIEALHGKHNKEEFIRICLIRLCRLPGLWQIESFRFGRLWKGKK